MSGDAKPTWEVLDVWWRSEVVGCGVGEGVRGDMKMGRKGG